MTVRVEREGPVTTVVLDRPAVRNAVDGPTAAALAEAFHTTRHPRGRRGPTATTRTAAAAQRDMCRFPLPFTV